MANWPWRTEKSNHSTERVSQDSLDRTPEALRRFGACPFKGHFSGARLLRGGRSIQNCHFLGASRTYETWVGKSGCSGVYVRYKPTPTQTHGLTRTEFTYANEVASIAISYRLGTSRIPADWYRHRRRLCLSASASRWEVSEMELEASCCVVIGVSMLSSADVRILICLLLTTSNSYHSPR